MLQSRPNAQPSRSTYNCPTIIVTRSIIFSRLFKCCNIDGWKLATYENMRNFKLPFYDIFYIEVCNDKLVWEDNIFKCKSFKRNNPQAY